MRICLKRGLFLIGLWSMAASAVAGPLDEVTIDVIERQDGNASAIIQRIEFPAAKREGAVQQELDEQRQEVREVIRQGSDLRRLRSESIREKAVWPK